MKTRLAVLPVLALIAAAGLRAGAEERRDVLFYSDLGPDSVDVSTYPEQTRRDYAVYARACSRCHGLARSINAPFTSRGWWEFYMTGMRLRGKASGRALSREEVKSVLDFLEYDSRVRKLEHAADFEKSTEDLKLRFAAAVDRRMSDLQNTPQPRLLPDDRPRR